MVATNPIQLHNREADSSPDSASSTFSPALTGLRGLAAAWVLLFHTQEANARFGNIAPSWLSSSSIIDAGWSGVDLFFILSGFVLMQAHGRNFTRPSWTHTLAFLKLRIARVYPLNAAVAIFIGLLALDHGFVKWDRVGDASNLGLVAFIKTILLATRWFLPGHGEWNGPVWSLSAEMLGYLVFPIVAYYLMQSRSRKLIISVSAGSILAWAAYQIVFEHKVSNYILKSADLRMVCCFLAGAALGRLKDLSSTFSRTAMSRIALIASASVLAAASFHFTLVLLPALFAIIIFSASFNAGIVNVLLISPIVQFIGRISFPLYLLSFMPLEWILYRLGTVHATRNTALLVLFAYLALIVCLSLLFHIFVERPSHRFGRLWANQGALRRTRESAPL